MQLSDRCRFAGSCEKHVQVQGPVAFWGRGVGVCGVGSGATGSPEVWAAPEVVGERPSEPDCLETGCGVIRAALSGANPP